MLGLSLAIPDVAITTHGTGGVPVPPPGFILLVDSDGSYRMDADGAYLMEPI